MFAGVADQSKPGAIQVFRHNFERSSKSKDAKEVSNFRF